MSFPLRALVPDEANQLACPKPWPGAGKRTRPWTRDRCNIGRALPVSGHGAESSRGQVSRLSRGNGRMRSGLESMRALGIDFGEKRIGLAISDQDGRIAVPLVTLERRDDLSAVREIA